MKNIINCILIFTVLLAFTACEENFDEINTNSVDPVDVDQVFLLNNAIIGSSFSTGGLKYDIGIVQQIITPNSGLLTGANYNQENRDGAAEQWVDYYETVIKHTGDLISRLSDMPEQSNLLNMGRLIQAYTFMVLTDDYGDIPYFEAGKGYSDQIVLPAYDSQKDIYMDLIKEVKEATAAFSDSADPVPGEVLYSGDLDKWRKLGNSLLLRIGMRLVKVNPAMAEELVKDAVAGGVMTSNDDNYVIRHDNNFTNSIGATLNGSEANNYYLVDTFVDYLKSTGDPRLQAIAVRYVGASSGPEQIEANASRDPDDQIGMPMGHDNITIQQVVTNLGIKSFYAFSQADRTRIAKTSSPMFMLTYAQTQLLLAEAAVRGWINGSPQEYYNNGVRGHMMQMAYYDEDTAVAEEDIEAYLAENPYDSSNAMEQINTQYWVASFLNGPEAFANFRRTGYPDLEPNTYPGQDISGDFIHRLTYPTSEIAVNSENVEAAIARMGPDNLDTRVWWDK